MYSKQSTIRVLAVIVIILSILYAFVLGRETRDNIRLYLYTADLLSPSLSHSNDSSSATTSSLSLLSRVFRYMLNIPRETVNNRVRESDIIRERERDSERERDRDREGDRHSHSEGLIVDEEDNLLLSSTLSPSLSLRQRNNKQRNSERVRETVYLQAPHSLYHSPKASESVNSKRMRIQQWKDLPWEVKVSVS